MENLSERLRKIWRRTRRRTGRHHHHHRRCRSGSVDARDTARVREGQRLRVLPKFITITMLVDHSSVGPVTTYFAWRGQQMQSGPLPGGPGTGEIAAQKGNDECVLLSVIRN